jgi:hypothetical protein
MPRVQEEVLKNTMHAIVSFSCVTTTSMHILHVSGSLLFWTAVTVFLFCYHAHPNFVNFSYTLDVQWRPKNGHSVNKGPRLWS